MKSLEQVLADARGEAAVLRHNGHGPQAASVERVCDAVADAMAPFLEVLSESEAQLRSGYSVDWLRSRFAEWEARGLAMLDERGKRRYRAIVLPVGNARTQAKLAGVRGESLRRANG